MGRLYHVPASHPGYTWGRWGSRTVWAFQVHAHFLMGTVTRSKTYIFKSWACASCRQFSQPGFAFDFSSFHCPRWLQMPCFIFPRSKPALEGRLRVGAQCPCLPPTPRMTFPSPLSGAGLAAVPQVGELLRAPPRPAWEPTWCPARRLRCVPGLGLPHWHTHVSVASEAQGIRLTNTGSWVCPVRGPQCSPSHYLKGANGNISHHRPLVPPESRVGVILGF